MKVIPSQIFILLILVSVLSCQSINSTQKSSSVKLYKTFFVGDDGIQYHIKPLLFKKEDESLLIDMTFRHKEVETDTVSVLFSLLSEDLVKELDLFSIATKTDQFVADQVESLYSKRLKRGYETRFSTIIPLSQLKKLIETGSDWEIQINQKKYFVPTKKTTRSLKTLNADVFVLF